MVDIRNTSDSEVKTSLGLENKENFRIKQINEWIWKKGVCSFDEMTSLSKDLRNKLKEKYVFNPLQIASIQNSSDQTRKFLFKLYDDNLIEGVLIPQDKRITACISSQSGCPFNCLFCATGKMDFARNLEPGEIYDQVRIFRQKSIEFYSHELSNIVIMGMGEPLMNYDNVIRSLEKITTKEGLEISPKRITLSTVGIIKKIYSLSEKNIKVNLAVSLHSAIQEKRDYLMPQVKSNSLADLKEALKYYYSSTKKQVTFKYLLLKDYNDSYDDARALISYCSDIASKVNIIEYNSIQECEFSKSTKAKTEIFIKYLQDKNINVQKRISRGLDIDAACGQLASKSYDKKKV